jgi:hypothetical protein
MHLEQYFFLSTKKFFFWKKYNNNKIGKFLHSNANMTNFAKLLGKKMANDLYHENWKKIKIKITPELELASEKELGFYILVPIFLLFNFFNFKVLNFFLFFFFKVEWLMIMLLFEDGYLRLKKSFCKKKVNFQLLLSNLNQKNKNYFLFFSICSLDCYRFLQIFGSKKFHYI